MQLSSALTTTTTARDLPTVPLNRPGPHATATGTGPEPAAASFSSPTTPKPADGGSDRLSVGGFTRVREALSREAEVRAEVVARGRALAANPDYPAYDLAQKIAALLLTARG